MPPTAPPAFREVTSAEVSTSSGMAIRPCHMSTVAMVAAPSTSSGGTSTLAAEGAPGLPSSTSSQSLATRRASAGNAGSP
jgi:hypothetical protein